MSAPKAIAKRQPQPKRSNTIHEVTGTPTQRSMAAQLREQRASVRMLAEADRLEPNFKKAKRFGQILQPLTISPTLSDAENVFRCVTQLYEQSERSIPVDPATLSRPLPAVPQRVHSKKNRRAAAVQVPCPMDVDVDPTTLASCSRVGAVAKRIHPNSFETLETLSRQTGVLCCVSVLNVVTLPYINI